MTDWRTKENLKDEIEFHKKKYIDDMEDILTGLAIRPSDGKSEESKLYWYKTQVEIAQEQVEKFIARARSTETLDDFDAYKELKVI